MTEISFHFNAADPLAYICRLLRKAVRQGAQVVVTGAAEKLARLDQQLWAFDPVSFVPHVLQRAGKAVDERLQATPVWLVEDATAARQHEVLVNLGGEGVP